MCLFTFHVRWNETLSVNNIFQKNFNQYINGLKLLLQNLFEEPSQVEEFVICKLRNVTPFQALYYTVECFIFISSAVNLVDFLRLLKYVCWTHWKFTSHSCELLCYADDFALYKYSSRNPHVLQANITLAQT